MKTNLERVQDAQTKMQMDILLLMKIRHLKKVAFTKPFYSWWDDYDKMLKCIIETVDVQGIITVTLTESLENVHMDLGLASIYDSAKILDELYARNYKNISDTYTEQDSIENP